MHKTANKSKSCTARRLRLLVVFLAAFLFIPAKSPAQASDAYLAVQHAFLQEQFAQVVSLAQNFILQNPTEPQISRVWLWMVLSLDKLKEYNEALRELGRLKDRLSSRDPLWPEILYWEGDIARRSFQMSRSKVAYQKLLDRYPDSSWTLQALLGLGVIELHQQHFEDAIPYFHGVITRQPDSQASRDAAIFEGLCHLQLGHFPQSVEVLKPLLDKVTEPGHLAQAAFYLGESYSGLSHFEDAIPAYLRVVDLPQVAQWSHPALFGLGWAYFRAGKCEESIKTFDRYLHEAGEDHWTEAVFAQGRCLLALGRETEALSALERVFSRDPSHPLAVESGLTVADIYRRQARPVLARQVLNSLLSQPIKEASRGQAQVRLAALALEEGNASQAKALYIEAGNVSEVSVRQAALNGQGDTAVFSGELDEARQAYQKAIDVDKDSSLAVYAGYQIGRLHMQAKEFDEAVDVFTRLSKTPDSAISDDARLALSLAYLNLGKQEQARSLLDEIRKQRSTGAAAARAAYYLAVITVKSGDDAGARFLCGETIAKAAKSEESVDARLLLADIISRESSNAEAAKWLEKEYASSELLARQRGRLAKRLGDLYRAEAVYTKAILWYDEAAKLLPSLRGEAMYRIASCYEETGDADLAVQWYKLVDQSAWKIRAQLALAKFFERQDKLEEAKAVYRQLLQEKVPEAKIAEERLEELAKETTNQAKVTR